MQEERLKGYLGLATKAGKLVTGYNTCLDMMPGGKLKLIILARDVGENTREKFRKKCEFYGLPMRIGLEADEMSKAVGKTDKGIFGITDQGFAKSMMSVIDEKMIENKTNLKKMNGNKSEKEVF